MHGDRVWNDAGGGWAYPSAVFATSCRRPRCWSRADEPDPHHPVFTFILTNYFNTVTPQYNLCVLPLTIYSKLLCINFEVYNSKNFTLQGV